VGGALGDLQSGRMLRHHPDLRRVGGWARLVWSAAFNCADGDRGQGPGPCSAEQAILNLHEEPEAAPWDMGLPRGKCVRGGTLQVR
jgi:hypothetical protein